MTDPPPTKRSRGLVLWRTAWVIVTVCIVQGLVCGLSILPILQLWSVLVERTASNPAGRLVVLSLAVAPSYVLFAMLLMALSGLSTRVTGWRTPPDAEMRIADLEWPLLNWVRYMVAIHLVRFFAGSMFRGSPIWTAYLRWNGARLGRRVYINSLAVSDHNLLEFGDDVVIGGDVHISGHTVEHGLVKTGRVRLGRHVTIGLGTVVNIDVDIGPDTQVGALSLVPKHTTLAARAIYVGIPVRRLDTHESQEGPGLSNSGH